LYFETTVIDEKKVIDRNSNVTSQKNVDDGHVILLWLRISVIVSR